MIKQYFWYYSHQMRFTCPSTVWEKYLHRFNVILIIFYIIFSPRMNHIEDVPLLWIEGIYVSSPGSICGVKLVIAEVWFVFVSPESFSVGCSASGVSAFLIWLCWSWLLIELSLNWEKAWSTNSPYGSNFILFLFTTSWNPCFCSLFCYNRRQPDSNCFSSLNVKNKSITW